MPKMNERAELWEVGAAKPTAQFDKTLELGVDNHVFHGLRRIANDRDMGIRELAAKVLKMYVAEEELRGRNV